MRDRYARDQRLIRDHDFWGSPDDDDGYERDKDEELDAAISRLEYDWGYCDAWDLCER